VTLDKQCSALGLGVIETYQAKIMIGTRTFVDYYYVTDRRIKPSKETPIFSYLSAIKGKWNIEGSMSGAGSMLKWFKESYIKNKLKQLTF